MERPFAEAKRQAAMEHVLTATRRLAVARGLDITMDQIAAAAGVSRRTLFRLFDSRERLIGVVFAAGMANYNTTCPPTRVVSSTGCAPRARRPTE